MAIFQNRIWPLKIISLILSRWYETPRKNYLAMQWNQQAEFLILSSWLKHWDWSLEVKVPKFVIAWPLCFFNTWEYNKLLKQFPRKFFKRVPIEKNKMKKKNTMKKVLYLKSSFKYMYL